MKRVAIALLFLSALPTVFLGAEGRARLVVRKPGETGATFPAAIVYSRGRVGGASALMLMDATGTQTRVLFEQSSTTSRLASPRFSPDGTKIAFRNGSALYVMPVAGGTPWKITDLADSPGLPYGPSWSPDSRFILFADSTGQSELCEECRDYDLFLLELDGNAAVVPGSRVRLTATPHRIELFPSWSRNGRRFVATVSLGGNAFHLIVYDFDATSRSITDEWILTGSLAPMAFGPGGVQWNRSSTSFPSDVVAFSAYYRNSGGNFDLWFIDVGTGVADHVVATHANYEVRPSFSPDDSRMVFLDEPRGTSSGRLSIVENAAEVIRTPGTVPVVTATAATYGSLDMEIFEVDWNPAP